MHTRVSNCIWLWSLRHVGGKVGVLLPVLVCVLSGCSSQRDAALEEFARWQDSARAQAVVGQLGWTELYHQSFDRLTALPPSLHQDARLASTVLLLSNARKFEASEITVQQFTSERDHLEARLADRLR